MAAPRRLPTLAVALLLLLAGCGSGGSAGGANTVNPDLEATPSETVSPSASPETQAAIPTVEDGDLDPFRIAAKHRGVFALRNGSFSYVRTVRASNGTVLLRQSSSGRIVGESLVYEQVTEWQPNPVTDPPGPNVSLWADEGQRAERFGTRDGGVRYRYGTSDPPSAWYRVASGQNVVYGLLAPWEPSYVGSTRTMNGTIRVFEQRADVVNRTSRPSARNLSVSVRIADAGIVYLIAVQYQTTISGVEVTVTERFRTTGMDVTVPRPDWVDQARERGQNATG